VATGAPRSEDRRTLVNFGGNRSWRARCYRPRDEGEVRDILARHRAERIRAIGSLHSWSDIAVTPGITLHMSRFDEVEPRAVEGVVRVGAGCKLQDLLDRLHADTDRTLPTLGVIKRQTIAGVISTATHGSGRQSVSHFVTAVRVAAYDPSGKPDVFEYRTGDELRAARCGLGCMGVILSVELRSVPKYRVRETVRRFDRIDDVLALYGDHPLTQFALVPYGWKIIAWERDALPGAGPGGGWLKARFFRFFNLVGVDVFSHVLLKASLLFGGSVVKALMKLLPRLLITDCPRIDDSERVLTMRHHLFRHEEMEMFVPESKVAEAAELLRSGIEIFAGEVASVPAEVARKLSAAGLYDELMQGRGSYVHHYPALFRRVLPEDALVSMVASASEPWFSFSLFTYERPGKRNAYYGVCSWFARAMHALFGARLHWGKHYPLGAVETARMYPHLERFRQICRASDPAGVFRNDFTDSVLEQR
jgi:FAD/FMN-containing dehydrogenase